MRYVRSKSLTAVENMDDLSLLWLTGLLEGEATFGRKANKPYIRLVMIDEDTVTKAANLVCRSVTRSHTPSAKAKGQQPVFVTELNGWAAEALMNRMRFYMGQRRQQQIAKALAPDAGVVHHF